jgi:hypothetical protein
MRLAVGQPAQGCRREAEEPAGSENCRNRAPRSVAAPLPRAALGRTGITFYIVRNRKGRLLSVQMPPEDCEIVAAIDPPSSRHARTFV